MAATLELPRSVLLALWLAADYAGVATDLIAGDDEPHELVGDGPYEHLDDLIHDTCGSGNDFAAVLPVPGDPLVGPPEAAAAGEAVLVHTHEGWTAALVPRIERFGSHLEPGHLVTWHVTEVPDWRTALEGIVGSLDDAEADLREGLQLATEALLQLDVARWRPEAAEQIAVVREGALPTDRIPPRLEGQRVRVLAQAARLSAIVDLATQDDGGAVNLWQADQRSTALREVDRLARRAMSAATAVTNGDEIWRYNDERRGRGR